MDYKKAIFKRTTVVSKTGAALSWAGGYQNEKAKHKGNLEFANGISMGTNYQTSRPPGTLSVHGYGKNRVATISLTTALKDNDAVMAYLKEHCLTQRRKRRKTLGIRIILSMDPAKVEELVKARTDVDVLLIRAIETTFKKFTERFYPGDELTYIVGIHHDARVNQNSAWVAFQKRRGLYQDKPSYPNVHAHVFLLPQTRNGLRISLSNRTEPGRNGVREDVLDVAREIYQEQIGLQVYGQEVEQPSPEWNALIREAAVNALDDYYESSVVDLKEGLKFAARKFNYYLQTMDRDSLRRRHHHRRQECMGYVIQDQAKLRQAVQERITLLTDSAEASITRRTKILKELADKFTPEPNPAKLEVKFWDLPSRKAGILLTSGSRHPGKVIARPSRAADIKQATEDWESRTRGNRLQRVAELTYLELMSASLRHPAIEPEWIHDLARIAQKPKLPHQEILAAPESEHSQPASAPGQPTSPNQPPT